MSCECLMQIRKTCLFKSHQILMFKMFESRLYYRTIRNEWYWLLSSGERRDINLYCIYSVTQWKSPTSCAKHCCDSKLKQLSAIRPMSISWICLLRIKYFANFDSTNVFHFCHFVFPNRSNLGHSTDVKWFPWMKISS